LGSSSGKLPKKKKKSIYSCSDLPQKSPVRNSDMMSGALAAILEHEDDVHSQERHGKARRSLGLQWLKSYILAPGLSTSGHLSCKGENASLLFVDVILSLFPPNRGSNREDLEEENELGLSDKDG
jgi:hypothetical protein